MSKYNLDTKKIREQSDLILKEIDNFEKTINAMFQRVIDIPTKTKEWEGQAAYDFAEIAKNEKAKEFDAIISRMRKYANELKQAGSEFESVERNTRADDKNITEQR